MHFGKSCVKMSQNHTSTLDKIFLKKPPSSNFGFEARILQIVSQYLKDLIYKRMFINSRKNLVLFDSTSVIYFCILIFTLYRWDRVPVI